MKLATVSLVAAPAPVAESSFGASSPSCRTSLSARSQVVACAGAWMACRHGAASTAAMVLSPQSAWTARRMARPRTCF